MLDACIAEWDDLTDHLGTDTDDIKDNLEFNSPLARTVYLKRATALVAKLTDLAAAGTYGSERPLARAQKLEAAIQRFV